MGNKAPSNPKSQVATPANMVTILRILLVPVFVAALLCPWPEWMGLPEISTTYKSIVAALIFIVISCTDALDGYLARSRGEVTDFGKFMDPLADKILVAAALIALVELGKLPTWAVLVILIREFIVSGLRMMAASKGVVIAASYIGKSKTVFQMIAIVMFIVKDSELVVALSESMNLSLYIASWTVMIIALALTIISLIDYMAKARDIIGLGSSEPSDCSSIETEIEGLAKSVVEKAIESNKTIGCAESLTGGLVCASLTAVPGSSAVVKGGVNSYVNEVKHNVLGVSEQTLETEGAVCEHTACQMAQGALGVLGCDIAVSVTGIAGPTGEEPGKPVGTVYRGIASKKGSSAVRFNFDGDRDSIRKQTTKAALEALLAELG